MAAADLPLCQALLVSPVVDMPGLIEGMMQAAGVTPEQLEREKVIPVPDAQPLDWEYYCYVREHRPDSWTVPTAVLIGERDELEPPAVTEAFCKAHGCGLEQIPGADTGCTHRRNSLFCEAGWSKTSAVAESRKIVYNSGRMPRLIRRWTMSRLAARLLYSPYHRCDAGILTPARDTGADSRCGQHPHHP